MPSEAARPGAPERGVIASQQRREGQGKDRTQGDQHHPAPEAVAHRADPQKQPRAEAQEIGVDDNCSVSASGAPKGRADRMLKRH